MNTVRVRTGDKSLANEIADSAGFERAGWLKILEFQEYATVTLISKKALACGIGQCVNEKSINHIYIATINAQDHELL